MKKYAALMLGLLAIMAASCQPKAKVKVVTSTLPETAESDWTLLVDFVKQTIGTPVENALAFPECRSDPLAKPIQSDAVEAIWYNYEDLAEQNIDIISQVLAGSAFKTELTNRTKTTFTLKSEKQELLICRADAPLGSVEDAGLSINRASNLSLDFYTKVMADYPDLKLPSLPKVSIGLLPKYTTDRKRREQLVQLDGTKMQKATQTIQTQTDNAAYSPFGDDTLGPNPYAISVLPQSQEAREWGLFNGQNLWEFPVVFHHEFGHHVFQMLFGDSTILNFRRYQDYWKTHPHLHQILEDKLRLGDRNDRHFLQERAAFLASSGFLFSAMNESFADLFAYYSLGQNAEQFDINCFRQTRDVADATMFGGMTKRWDKTIWNEIFAINPGLGAKPLDYSGKTPIEICSTPSFADNHIVGAVIAHTMDAAFSAVVASKAIQEPSKFKAALLFSWTMQLKQTAEVLELSNKQTLSRIINVGLGRGLEALGAADKSSYCQIVAEKFPVFLTRWSDKPHEDEAGILLACPGPRLLD